jgi:hypothetical protein
MKILTYFLAGALFLLTGLAGYAQPDTAKITQRALFFADSLVKTDKYANWAVYSDLVQASVVKYYGGKPGYIEHISNIRKKTVSEVDEADPELKVLNLMTENDQWQCVIRVSRYFHKEDKKYHFVTYFIGQSKDEGQTWRLFDVSYNSVANIIYMFPDVFGDMPIKESTILTEEQELAAQQKAKEAAAAGKKASVKKK